MKFDEPHALNSVAEFHRMFNLPVNDIPVIPDADRCQLRINLLEEELQELKTAVQKKDLVAVADAFCDLQYVLSGAILEFGLGEKFKSLFDEVQRSNMSKVCHSIEEAKKTVEYYRSKRQMEGTIVEKASKFLVFRQSDGKVLKSVNYSQANLKAII